MTCAPHTISKKCILFKTFELRGLQYLKSWKNDNSIKNHVIIVGETVGERERENRLRMKYFLASLSFSQMACDSGLFHLCNSASAKDERTVLFLVINWILVGVKILIVLTRTAKTLTLIYFDQSLFPRTGFSQTGPWKQSPQPVWGPDTWK